MVTIKQIAQEVGISSSTVSIVLGGKAEDQYGHAGKNFCGGGTAWLPAQYGCPEPAGRQRCQ